MRINRSLGTSSFNEALRAVRKIAYEIELEFERLRSVADSTGACGTLTPATSRPAVAATVPKADGRTLRQTIDAYMADPARSRTVKSEAVYRTSFATISAILGHETPVAEIGRNECRDLLTVLQALPSNARKRFPHLSPRGVAEHARAHGIAPMSTANINEYMNKLSTLLNWALAEEWVNRNPAKGLRVAEPSIQADRRRPFSTQQLVRIFNAPLYRGCRDDGLGYAIEGNARLLISAES